MAGARPRGRVAVRRVRCNDSGEGAPHGPVHPREPLEGGRPPEAGGRPGVRLRRRAGGPRPPGGGSVTHPGGRAGNYALSQGRRVPPRSDRDRRRGEGFELAVPVHVLRGRGGDPRRPRVPPDRQPGPRPRSGGPQLESPRDSGERDPPYPRPDRRAEHPPRRPAGPREGGPCPQGEGPSRGVVRLPVERARVPAAGEGPGEAWARGRDREARGGGAVSLRTTSVGSFPKPPYLAKARTQHSKGELPDEALRALEERATKEWIAFQEESGIDILVDGEQYRGDMATYLRENHGGCAVSGLGRSHGNRYYKKPLVVGELDRPGPITVDWWTWAQSLTQRPLKGMLTGPYTMMDWSFNEHYASRADLALAFAKVIHPEARDRERE